MKHIFIPVVITITAVSITSCNNNAEKQSNTDSTAINKDTVVVLQTTEVGLQVKPSDEHFDAALNAFSKKEPGESAKFIRYGIASFKKETASDTGTTKLMAEAAIKNLDGLDEKVEKGEVKDINILENAFDKAEDANLHREFVSVSDIVIPEKQDGLKADFGKAVSKLKTTVTKDKGKMKAAGEKIVKKGEAIKAKLDSGAKTTKKEMQEFNNEAKNWLETHI